MCVHSQYYNRYVSVSVRRIVREKMGVCVLFTAYYLSDYRPYQAFLGATKGNCNAKAAELGERLLEIVPKNLISAKEFTSV